ncbi:MAG: spermidine/putrescine transport system permease protein [Rhodospirillaceae bacterium]|nr:spermidine/putrescine transport system permease protein [Rhodospirillaceae bacterium]
MRGGRSLIPYMLVLPGAAWLIVLFLVPLAGQVKTSLEEGSLLTGMAFTGHWQNYADALVNFGPVFLRSFVYAGLATLLTISIGYPLAYFIVFRGGRFKALLLFPVIVPFLITYLVRTLSWQALLADSGIVLGTLKAWHLIPQDSYLLGTPTAVVFALAYNFLPFSVLPIYTSLDRIDPTLLRAAADLYASPFVAFRKVVLPLSLPGVFAGSLLTFIPAAGDFVNAMMLGAPQKQMIGNVIQGRYLVTLDYPLAAAASLILMVSLLVCVAAYSRLFGTEELTG